MIFGQFKDDKKLSSHSKHFLRCMPIETREVDLLHCNYLPLILCCGSSLQKKKGQKKRCPNGLPMSKSAMEIKIQAIQNIKIKGKTESIKSLERAPSQMNNKGIICQYIKITYTWIKKIYQCNYMVFISTMILNFCT